MTRLIDRLSERASARFVGRDAELALIGASLDADPPPVSVFLIHGPGGVGKTALLERVRGLAAGRAIDALRLDARDVEPSPEGLLRALGTALGLAPEHARLDAVVARWADHAARRRLLLLDSFEHLSHLQGWLRQRLLPELPDRSLVLIAGRTPPDADWQTDPLWREGARVVALSNLAPHESDRFLAQRGVPAPARQALIELGHGHPLALTLLADVALGGGGNEEMPHALSADALRRLCDCFVARAPSELHRRALELCAKARHTTEGLLADVLGAGHAHALFEWLASLNFIEAARAGLFPHDLVRDAIDDELRWRHPERHREAHLALRAHFLRLLAHGDERQRLLAMFDLMYLYRRAPVMPRYVDFRALGSVWFERYAPGDRARVLALAARERPAQECAQIAGWLAHPASQVYVMRPAPGAVAGAMVSIDLAALKADERRADPVLERVWRRLQAGRAPAPGQSSLVARHLFVDGGVLQPSAAMNALQLSQAFQWATLPDLAHYVNCTPEPAHWAPMMDFIGFERMPDCDFAVAGVPHGCWLHDWRAQPIGQWQAMVAARQLGLPDPCAPSDKAGAMLDRDGMRDGVREALRRYADETALQGCVLAGCAFVVRGRNDGETPARALQRMLLETAQLLRGRARDEKFWRALELTFFKPAGSQELAAERLGLPFGTYRYQLATGIRRVADLLWRRELAART